jgi:perosamine synthetase
LPYGRHSVSEEDIAAVVEVLRSEWLTTGPVVPRFEEAFAQCVGASHAVGVSSGTAGLHAAMFAAGVGPGDEVIVPAITFAATANAVCFQQATPVFADVDETTLLLTADTAAERITSRTKAIVAVDYAGQPCDYEALKALCGRHGLALVADACHALGAKDRGRPVGSLADLNVFSCHPVKHITTGEGGVVTTDSPKLADRLRLFRNHGISTDHWQRQAEETWHYEMVELGYNYRLSDIHCALGLSQLSRLPEWLRRRREIARRYDRAWASMPLVRPLAVRREVEHAYHLYVVRAGSADARAEMFCSMRSRGIGVHVHYLPVYLHPYYRRRWGGREGLCPAAEAAYNVVLSLPIFPGMSREDVEFVIECVRECDAPDEMLRDPGFRVQGSESKGTPRDGTRGGKAGDLS